MTNLKHRSIEECARNVKYAYDNTQRQFDEHPPKNDNAPIAAAINGWTLICGCYMGIEQTMKCLILMRDGCLVRTHDLGNLFLSLDPSERDVVATYYRVYRSLHNFDTGSIALETACEFIQYIGKVGKDKGKVGKGYEAWRYILIEDHKEMPKMHLGMMLEIWRALAYLVGHRVSGRNYPYRTVDGYLEDYIEGVFRDAQRDEDWQAASLDENTGVNFSEICDWLHHKGRALEAGIDLFTHRARGSENSIEASPLLRQVLLRAADKAVFDPPTHRRADIVRFHHRICGDGLTWNATKGVFE